MGLKFTNDDIEDIIQAITERYAERSNRIAKDALTREERRAVLIGDRAGIEAAEQRVNRLPVVVALRDRHVTLVATLVQYRPKEELVAQAAPATEEAAAPVEQQAEAHAFKVPVTAGSREEFEDFLNNLFGGRFDPKD